MPRFRRGVSLGLLLIVILAVLNVAGLALALSWVSFPWQSPANPPWLRYRYDGSVLVLQPRFPPGTWRVTVVEPPSLLGALKVWWPAAASGALTLLVAAAARAATVRRLMAQRIHFPRITMFRGMVLIGTIALWLWLSGTETYWIVCSFPVLLLMFISESRRSKLAREIKAAPSAASAWTRLLVAGYSVAVLLAICWVAAVVVWDNFRVKIHG
jgi:hypothetical protein